MWQDFVILDYETSGLDYYKTDFKVISAAITHADGSSIFLKNETEVADALMQLAINNTPILTYNLSFELGVTRCVFPDIKLNFVCDVQRLVQVFDGGGEGEFQGFGLKRAIKRILKSEENHEAEIHEWIRNNVAGVKRGKEGAHISKAPASLIERYNVGDTEMTLKLYKHITGEFALINYDWGVDHALYLSTVHLIVDAKIQGVRVNREKLVKDLESLENEVAVTDTNFLDKYASEIRQVQTILLAKRQAKLKKRVLTLDDAKPFNITSKLQLKILFCDLLGLDCGFKTLKGSPSFKALHLPLYGEGGSLLAKRGKVLNHTNQCKALLQISEYDNRWHTSLKAVGTASGRLASGN